MNTNNNPDAEWQIGDEVATEITGMTLTYRAKVIGYDDRYKAEGTTPVLQVLNNETGEVDESWRAHRLKSGDYIINGKWEAEK